VGDSPARPTVATRTFLDDIEHAVDTIARNVLPQPSDEVVGSIYVTSQRVLQTLRVSRPIDRGLATASEQERIGLDEAGERSVRRLGSQARDLTARAVWMSNRLTSYAALLAVPAVIFGFCGMSFSNVLWIRRVVGLSSGRRCRAGDRARPVAALSQHGWR
jgi:hypothetical protein